MSKISRWIILPDMQIPYHDEKSLAAVENYIAAHRWDGWLQIGDFLDFDTISSFNYGKPRITANRYLNEDIEMANEILDWHQNLVRSNNKQAKFVLLEGNHEERVERWLDANPQFEGILSVPKMLRLKERGITWVPSWSLGETYSIGKAVFSHGLYTNKYHAEKMVNAWGQSIFYGHTHDMQCVPKAFKRKDDLIVGQSIGCLCEYEQTWMKGKPTNWQQGFMVLHVMPNGNFTYYTPRIINHQFIGPDGVLYKA